MLTDEQLARLIRELETSVDPDATPIVRAFDRIDADRQLVLRRRRQPWWLRILPGPRSLDLGLRPVRLLMLVSLVVGMLLGGLIVAGVLRPSEPPLNKLDLVVRPAASVDLPGRPYSMAVDGGSLWVANGNVVSRIDPATAKVQATIPTGSGAASVGAGPAGLWVASLDAGMVSRVDAVTNTLTEPTPVASPEFLAVGDADVWVASPTTGRVTRIDAATGRIAASVLVGGAPSQPVVGLGSVWIPHDCRTSTQGPKAGVVTRIDIATNRVVGEISGGTQACVHTVVVSSGEVWFTDSNDGTLTQIDPATNAILRTLSIGEDARGIVDMRAGGSRYGVPGALWLTVNPSFGQSGIALVDPVAGKVVAFLDLGVAPQASTVGLTDLFELDGSVWVAADVSEQPAVWRIDPAP